MALGSSQVSNRVAVVQISLTAIILAVYGVWGLTDCVSAHAWIPGIAPAASIIAATGVMLRKVWARILVFVLAGLFVGTWLFSLFLAVSAGAYRGWPPRNVVISLLPGAFYSGLAVFCCIVVAVRWWRS
jgi:hypothetical protein